MRKIKFFIIAVCILLLGNISFAQDKKWVDEAELSYVDTKGNTELTSLSAKNLLKYSFHEDLTGSWKLNALYGKNNNVKTAESYSTEGRLDSLLSKRLFTAVIGGWSKDKFAGIESRYYLGPAVGYKFFVGPKHFLESEIGINYVREEYTNGTEAEYPEGRVAGKYEYLFTAKNKFFQSLEFLYDFEDSDNYNINSETALLTALSDYLSLKTSYQIKYDNKPVPPTLDETDTILSVTLVVNF